MIYDNTENLKRYQGMGKDDRYLKAAQFLQSTDLTALPPGRYEIDGDAVYCNIAEYDSVPWEEARYESHQRYTDIQYVISGEEIMTFAPVEALKSIEEYDPVKDVIHYSNENPGLRIRVSAGEYMIFQPGEGHKSKGMVDQSIPMKKAVVKILED
ncbi:MAG: YhcH/YjgK/YiaL family protein [Firmicutes bacterium]|nr:YhcH/YjgK/YiaL family protein [Bacillota bacterium]